MIGSWRSLAGESGPWEAIPALLLVAALMAGCSLVGGENKLPRGQAAYPNLGAVPTQAPPASSSAERQQTSAGLVADRESAAQGDQSPAGQPAAAQAAAAQSPEADGGSYANNGAPIMLDADAPAGAQAQGAAAGGGGLPIALIYFRDSSTSLSGHDLAVLHDVYLIQRRQGGRIRLVGHASQSSTSSDPAAQSQINDRLSLARANAVARALLDMGTPRSALAVAAAGSAGPAHAGITAAGQAGNRRVDIYLDR